MQPCLLFLRDSLAVASCLLDDDFLFLRKKDLGDGFFTGACVQELLIMKKKGDFPWRPRHAGGSTANAAFARPGSGRLGRVKRGLVCAAEPEPGHEGKVSKSAQGT